MTEFFQGISLGLGVGALAWVTGYAIYQVMHIFKFIGKG